MLIFLLYCLVGIFEHDDELDDGGGNKQATELLLKVMLQRTRGKVTRARTARW